MGNSDELRSRRPKDADEILKLMGGDKSDFTTIPIIENDVVVDVVKITLEDQVRAYVEAGKAQPVRKNARAEANARVQYLVSALFDLDFEKKVTISDIRRVPAVRLHQKDQGLSDDRMNKLIGEVAPDYAKRSRGRPNEWDDPPEVWLKIPKK